MQEWENGRDDAHVSLRDMEGLPRLGWAENLMMGGPGRKTVYAEAQRHKAPGVLSGSRRHSSIDEGGEALRDLRIDTRESQFPSFSGREPRRD